MGVLPYAGEIENWIKRNALFWRCSFHTGSEYPSDSIRWRNVDSDSARRVNRRKIILFNHFFTSGKQFPNHRRKNHLNTSRFTCFNNDDERSSAQPHSGAQEISLGSAPRCLGFQACVSPKPTNPCKMFAMAKKKNANCNSRIECHSRCWIECHSHIAKSACTNVQPRCNPHWHIWRLFTLGCTDNPHYILK